MQNILVQQLNQAITYLSSVCQRQAQIQDFEMGGEFL